MSARAWAVVGVLALAYVTVAFWYARRTQGQAGALMGLDWPLGLARL